MTSARFVALASLACAGLVLPGAARADDLSVPRLVPSGVTMRLLAGYSSILHGKDDRCASPLPASCPSSLGEHRWYGGFALGYAF